MNTLDHSSESYGYDVCIIGGGGHIGLPLGVALACTGLKTVLLDVNKKNLDTIMSGVFPFKEDRGTEKLQEALSRGTLFGSSDPSVIGESSIIITVIGTPIDEYLNPNFLGIIRTVNDYIEHFRDGQIFILRSTVYPGTSERVQRFFEKNGKDVRVAFCPERIVEGKAFEEMKKLPQIISAFDEKTLERVKELFQRLTERVIVPVKPIEAELSKLFCNAWRYISFAVANQFFMIASEYNLDYHSIFKAMTEDYSRMKDLPNPGFAAGPCLLKDTMQLAAFNNNHFLLGHAAMLVNEGLPGFIMQKIKEQYPDLKHKTIGILGMAFKPESDDQRDSLSFKLRKVANTEAQEVLCHDPYIKSSEFFELEEVLSRSDIILLSTPHRMYMDIPLEARSGKIYVDVWNAWGRGFLFVS